jgi:putative transposase
MSPLASPFAGDLLPVSWSAESWKIPVLQPGPEAERAMKKSKFREAQIAFILKQAEEGTPVAGVCRKTGISDVTFYGWRKKYAGLMPSEMKRLRVLEEENGKLKKLVADLSLDKAMLQDVLSRSCKACAAAPVGR